MVFARVLLLAAALSRASGQVISDDPVDCGGCLEGETDISEDPELAAMFADQDSFDLKQETLKLAEQMNARVQLQQFRPLRFRSQLVAGMNYFVRVQTGESEFADIYIFEDWLGAKSPEVVAAHFFAAPEDPIDTFGLGSVSASDVNTPKPVEENCYGCRSAEREPSEDVLEFFKEYGPQLRRQAQQQVRIDKVFAEFVPVRFADQRVAGRVLFVKVRVDTKAFIDIEVFEPPTQVGENAVPQILGLTPDVNEDDPIGNFDSSVLV